MSELQDRQIVLGGQAYTIRFSIRAMLVLKTEWGLAKEAEVEARMKKAGLEDFVTILWAGLQTHHPDMTQDKVLSLMDDGGVAGIEAIQEAIEAAAPRPPRKGQSAKKPRRR